MTTDAATDTPRSQPARADAYPIELVALRDLSPHPRNFRDHPEEQLAHLRQSLQEIGVMKNIVISADDVILAGHGLVKAARQLKMEKLPVWRLPFPHLHPLALKIVVIDNESARLGVRDDRALASLLQSLHREHPSHLLGTGYNAADVETLTNSLRPKVPRVLNHADTSWQLLLHFDTETALNAFAERQGLATEPGAVRALHVMPGRLRLAWVHADPPPTKV